MSNQFPPLGDPEQTENYLARLINLLKQNKLQVTKTDLSKFELSSMQDHYFLDLGEYEVEVSHSKKPDSGEDVYILLFNNVRKLQQADQSCTQKVILSYLHLTAAQFQQFKAAASGYLEKKRQAEESKRFSEVMTPVDQALEKIAAGPVTSTSVASNPVPVNQVAPNPPVPPANQIINPTPNQGGIVIEKLDTGGSDQNLIPQPALQQPTSPPLPMQAYPAQAPIVQSMPVQPYPAAELSPMPNLTQPTPLQPAPLPQPAQQPIPDPVFGQNIPQHS